jgi:hypothetical protein
MVIMSLRVIEFKELFDLLVDSFDLDFMILQDIYQFLKFLEIPFCNRGRFRQFDLLHHPVLAGLFLVSAHFLDRLVNEPLAFFGYQLQLLLIHLPFGEFSTKFLTFLLNWRTSRE